MFLRVPHWDLFYPSMSAIGRLATTSLASHACPPTCGGLAMELEEFKKTGEPAKQFTDIGTGPEGMTVKSADESTLKDYLQAIKK